jgi:hypothetical protein
METQKEYVKNINDLIKKSSIFGSNTFESTVCESECMKYIDELNRILLKAKEKLTSREKKRKTKKPAKFEKSKKWWCTILTILVKSRNYLARVSKSTNKERIYTKILVKRLNANIQRISRLRKSYIKWIERQELVEKYLKCPTLFWREVTNRSGTPIKMNLDREFLKKKYFENFNTLVQTSESKIIEEKMRFIVNEYMNKVKLMKTDYKVDRNTIISIIKKLKNGKKPGKNKISNEMFKYSTMTLVPDIIASVFTSMLNNCYCVKNINVGAITTIIKDSKGETTSFDNSRPITISESISMILEIFMMIDIDRKLKLNRNQYGFRANSSCAHAVFTIKEIAADARQKGKNAIALFLDFSKAFDKVNRTKLWYRLMSNSSPKYWLLMKNYYEAMTLHVEDENGEYTEAFSTKVGVKQGGNASPTLFNMVIDELLERCEKSGLLYQINDINVGLIVYADDTTVICESIEKLKCVANIIESFCQDYDITINSKKTKWMRLGPNYSHSLEDESIELGGIALEKVSEFKFLGVIICEDGTYKNHYKKRKTLYLNGISEINSLGFNKNDLTTQVKSLLYTSLARSKLVYGLETLNLKKNEIKSLFNTLEGNQVKRANNLSYNSKSKILIYAMGISPIEIYLLKRKLGFLIQLTNNEITSKLLEQGAHNTFKETFDLLDIVYDRDILLGNEEYLTLIRKKTLMKLSEIRIAETKIKNSKLVRCIKFLLNHRNVSNDDTIQYLLDPRRFKPG